MNILIVNTTYWGGGASRIARQLYEGAQGQGNRMYFCAGYDLPSTPAAQRAETIYRTDREKRTLAVCNSLMPDCQLCNPHSFLFLLKLVLKYKIDVIHFQNLHGGYVGLLDVWLLSRVCPCIITMHDMWDMTGNCVHANSCRQFSHGCKDCRFNRGSNVPILSRSSFLLQIKRRFLVTRRITFVSPARWLLTAGKESILKDSRMYCIPNGVNTEIFKLQDKKALRVKYRLAPDKKYIVFLSYDTADRKKGLPFLMDALEKLENPQEYVLITAGKEMRQRASLRQYQTVSFGYTKEDEKLSEIYGLGDLFVIPSLEDTFPCTTLEAMASGTPIAGFRTGGIVEQVDEETGFLTDRKDAYGLKKMIETAFEDMPKLRAMSLQCRKRVEEHFAEKRMLQAYRRLYHRANIEFAERP